MKRLFMFLLACLVIGSVVQFQKADARQDRVAVCHKGTVIWVATASVPAHMAHGDELAIQNSAGEWVCPCPAPSDPPPPCWDGSPSARWDPANCEWIKIPCPPKPCDPSVNPPPPDGCWDWNQDLCEWVPCQEPGICLFPLFPEPLNPPPAPYSTWCWDELNCDWIGCL